MNSVTQTGAVSLTAATLAPYVQWGLDGFPQPAPDGLALLIAASALTIAHAAYAFVKWKWFTPKPSTQEQSPHA